MRSRTSGSRRTSAPYWRNGGVLFNAMSGVDIALWDILAKRANMPLYMLLGGKVRHGADCYYHASGRDFAEVEANARKGMAAGFRHIRVQGGAPGMATYGARRWRSGGRRQAGCDPPSRSGRRRRARSGSRLATCGCCRSCSSTCASSSGDEVQLLHDVHERVQLNEAINLCKALGAVQPVLPRGSVPARRQRVVPHPAPADQRADRDGRAVQHGAGISAARLRAADRLHPHPHLADRRPEPGAQGGGALRVLRRPHRLARSRRRIAGRARRAARAGAVDLQLRHP